MIYRISRATLCADSEETKLYLVNPKPITTKTSDFIKSGNRGDKVKLYKSVARGEYIYIFTYIHIYIHIYNIYSHI